MGINLFGFQLGKKDVVVVEDPKQRSFALPTEALDDGAVNITQNAYYGTYVDLEGAVRNEMELITRYREMSNHPELESAISDITNEAISREDDGTIVEINLDNLEVTDNIKKFITGEYKNILSMLNFSNLADDLFKRWYIDGRLYFHVIVNETNPRDGIQELRYIDPRKIRKIREIAKERDHKSGLMVIKSIAEYYVYNERALPEQAFGTTVASPGIKIAPDSIVSVTSGLMDARNAFVVSYLNSAIKPLNQLRMIEDAVVIYRISRSPERRIFYVDVGNLPKGKAEQYLRDVMVKYRNKLVYNQADGSIVDSRKHLSMLEDFFIPRRDGCFVGSTKIKTLDGRDESLDTLIEEYNNGKENWVYSVSPEGKIVPGKITWAGYTRKNAEILDVYLDNGEVITATPDHKFILRNGTKIEAKDLQPGTSLMPLYNSVTEEGNIVFDNFEEKYINFNETITKFKIDNNINPKGIKVIKKCFKFDNLINFDDSNDYWKYYKTDITNHFENLQRQVNHNHKVVKIVYREDRQTVGTLTVDGNNEYHDYHNFALTAGVFVMNSKSTEITTLPGGGALSNLDDIDYFKKKLLQALHVPYSRLEPDGGGLAALGRTTEITRDELKFAKFIDKLRNRFSQLFDSILRIQLSLKGICTQDEWDTFREHIYYDYKKDNNFAELRESELLRERLGTLAQIDPYIGKYYSITWIKKNVLRQSDEEIEEINKEMKVDGSFEILQQAIAQEQPNIQKESFELI